MRGIIEFNLPEEENEFRQAMAATRYLTILIRIDEFLRSQIKYEEREELQEIRDKLWELINEYEVSLND